MDTNVRDEVTFSDQDSFLDKIKESIGMALSLIEKDSAQNNENLRELKRKLRDNSATTIALLNSQEINWEEIIELNKKREELIRQIEIYLAIY